MMRINHLIRFYFTNGPKNIPKPQPIQFNFKIPNRVKTHDDNSNASQVKVLKAKRNVDIHKILKKKKQGGQYKQKIAREYQQAEEQKIINNIKTSTYHQQEYFKGEQLLENIPLDPFYTYKLADFNRKLELKKDEYKKYVQGYTDYDMKAEAKFKVADLYHQKQQKYEVQEFLRYIDEYPGSPKGPQPEDDLEYFLQYAYKKIPAVLAKQLAVKQQIKQEQLKKATLNAMSDVQRFKLPQQSCFSQILGENRSLERPLDKDSKWQDQLAKFSDLPIYKDYEQIPQIPQMVFNNYQHWMRDWTNWGNFRKYYTEKHGQTLVEKQLQYLNEVDVQNDPEPENQYWTPSGNAPSLLRYYNTLPKEIQDHPGLKDIYLGLQFHCPYLSYEEKENTLNLACTMVLPMQKLTLRAMNDFVNEKKKFYITPFIVDKIFTINPQYTWDIKQFFAQIKRQQLKGQSMIKQNQGSYPEPPQVHLDWEQGVANLPVNYYENDDGFWDGIISEKLKRQDEAKPIMKSRKHFYH